MSTRTIPVQVNNEYVQGAGVAVGAAGSHNDVVLEIAFSPLWDGLAKKITWLDANGENATLTILTTNMLKTGETTVYQVPIPAEPKAYAGELTMTIKGATVSGSTETRATLSTSCTFRVLPSAYSNAADESGDVTPTQAEQLQAEIDDILETISAAEASANAAAASETAASGSATLAMEAKTAAEAAQAAAETAETNAETAEANAKTAKTAAEAAQAASEAAQGAAETAETNAESAETGAEAAAATATSKATEAAASATTAANKATAAAGSATAASGSAGAADASKTAAVAAKVAAETAQAAAEAAQTAAETAQAAAEAAETGAETAQGAAETAQAGAETAQSAAETAEGTATIKATEAGESAAAALASKNTAAGNAATAVDSAATAVGAAADAQTAQEAAEDAQSTAEASAASAAGSAAASESWAVGGTGTRAGEDTNNAHYWSIVAQGAAAGGVSTFNGRSGAVVPASGDYTPSMVGADASGAAAAALASAKSYADGLAPNYDQAGAAATVQGNLDAHTGNTANPHGVTKAQVGLGNVPNVATNDQTPTYSQASAIANLTSGEKLSVAFGKIMKAIADFITHKNSTGNPHGVTAAQAGADPTGTAASAISTHNGATDAHSGLFAAKATLDTGSLTLKIGRDSTGVYIEY